MEDKFIGKCQACQNDLEMERSQAGQSVQCPACGASTEVVLPKTKSTAALVLGILGLILPAVIGLFLSLAALIIGCKKKYKPGIIMGSIGLPINLLSVAVCVVVFLLPALNSSRERARRAHCVNNLRQIGIAMIMYAESNNEKYPVAEGKDGLELLSTGGHLIDENCYICPSADQEPSYAYIGEGVSSYSPDVPMVIEYPRNHGDGYINVLYLDGHVSGWHIPKNLKTIREVTEHLLRDVTLDDSTRSKLLDNAAKYNY